MNIPVWLLTLSLAANVLLAAWWLKSRPDAAPPESLPASAPAMSESTPNSMESRSAPASASVLSGSSRPKPAATAVATWMELETDELRDFVRQLRAAGCPEETVQDIILAEVNRRFAARRRALWPEQFEIKPFWHVQKNDPAENKKNRERSRAHRELEKEKSALLVELLGIDPEKEQRKAEGFPEPFEYWQSRVSFLPAEKQEAVRQYLDEFEDKMQDFHARNRGLWDSETRAEQRQLEAERMQGLARFLTPTELREYELRHSQLASQMGHDLRTMSVTREQYEAIFDIRKKYGDRIYNYGDVEGKEAREQVEQNKKAMQSDLAAALGADKARDYKRSQDYSYTELTRLAQRHDLPVDTAGKVYDFKDAAEEAVKQLKADTTLTDAQRQEALGKIRDETEQAVKLALGDRHYTNYTRSGGWWINQLAPRPPSPRPTAR